MSASELLELVLGERPAAWAGDDIETFWRNSRPLRDRFRSPLERAVAGGFSADRSGAAFACGYEAALQALVPSLGSASMASFSVTEEAGNHPRSIRTTLERVGRGKVVLRGKKRWSTLAPLSSSLVVVATAGTAEDGRPRLFAVVVPKGAARLEVTTMPPTAFVPEVPHAELSLDGVEVDEAAVLPGDGYSDFVKPFRTIEDLHVQAAVLGYALSAAARFGFPLEHRERLISAVLGASAIAALDPRRTETHVALAGLLAEIADVHTKMEADWERAEDAERARWYRDRPLVRVATNAREKRRQRAWERLAGERKP